ncbi:hypothetical protein AAEX28_08505 [Lentisphaerota bacterium WC36G]|nr:hypothetical protein LJT99_11360 [Lentisphaerae bacterium WC36]
MFENSFLNNISIITLLLVLITFILQAINFFNSKNHHSSKSKVKKVINTINLGAVAVAVVFVLIFAFFIDNNRVIAQNKSKDDAKITPTKLPENFIESSKEEISKSNEVAVTQKEQKVKKEATEANNKAMADSIKIFKNAK